DRDFRRAVEIAGTGNHDLFAFLQALQDLDLVDRARTQGHRRLVGDAVAHDIGIAAARFVHERTARDGQHVVALVEHDAHRQALVLAQLAGLLALEAYPRDHFTIHDFGRNRAYRALPVLAVAADDRGHAGREITRETFRHVHLHFQRGQVHHGKQLGVLRYRRRLCDEQLADLAVHRRTHVQFFHLALEVRDQQFLAFKGELLRLDFQREAGIIHAQIGLGVAQLDLRFFQRVVVAVDIELRHRALIESLLIALQVARGALLVDLGVVVGTLQFGTLLVGVDLGLLVGDLHRIGVALFLCQLVGQLGACDHRQHLTLGHLVTGMHLQCHRTVGVGVQRRTDRRDHAPVGGDVAHERTTLHAGDLQPRCTHRRACGKQSQRAGHQPDQQGQHQDADGSEDAQLFLADALLDHAVSSGCVANAHARSPAATTRPQSSLSKSGANANATLTTFYSTTCTPQPGKKSVRGQLADTPQYARPGAVGNTRRHVEYHSMLRRETFMTPPAPTRTHHAYNAPTPPRPGGVVACRAPARPLRVKRPIQYPLPGTPPWQSPPIRITPMS